MNQTIVPVGGLALYPVFYFTPRLKLQVNFSVPVNTSVLIMPQIDCSPLLFHVVFSQSQFGFKGLTLNQEI